MSTRKRMVAPGGWAVEQRDVDGQPQLYLSRYGKAVGGLDHRQKTVGGALTVEQVKQRMGERTFKLLVDEIGE